jgi:hypothetical protein
LPEERRWPGFELVWWRSDGRHVVRFAGGNVNAIAGAGVLDKKSGRFLKKAAQKLLFMRGLGHCRRQRPRPQHQQSFLAL